MKISGTGSAIPKKAEEIAELFGFLASEKAGYITGECISINGGLYM